MKRNQIILVLLLFMSYPSQINAQDITLSNATQTLTGTWLNDEDPSHKFVFTTSNKGYIFQGSELLQTYDYEIVSTNCNSYSAPTINFLKLTNTENGDVYCNEILNLTDNVLSLMEPGNAEITLYTKQE